MRLRELPEWQKLAQCAARMSRDETHLKYLTADAQRLNEFSLKGGGLFYDFSRQRVDKKTMEHLFDLGRALRIDGQFRAMTQGERINVTENRAALHTASRDFTNRPIIMDGRDVTLEIKALGKKIKCFADDVHEKRIVGSTGKPFRHIVVIGIGGSHFGTEFVAKALEMFGTPGMSIHFLSSLDSYHFEKIVSSIDPEAALWVVISKSFKTVETLANARLAKEFMKQTVPDCDAHFVSITAAKDTENDFGPPDQSFHMFDFIGGRYSVTSAAGGVPLSLFLGHDIFQRFLKGAHDMDLHAQNAPLDKNIPLIAALISVWNTVFLKYGALGIIPYAAPLSGLCPHIRQLHMESVGKSADIDGAMMDEPAGTVVFGEPGTNAQHSFFQLAHQGKPFPMEFIGIIKPWHQTYSGSCHGVSNHQELWANLIAQPIALAQGRPNHDPARSFSGNRPSSTIIIDELSPETIGGLLSFYEAKTVYEAFLWRVNPFDQFGVESGKKTASGIRDEIRRRNEKKEGGHLEIHRPETGAIEKFYMDMLFQGE